MKNRIKLDTPDKIWLIVIMIEFVYLLLLD